MISHPKTVLLTGASGVIGTALMPELACHRVIVLTHHRAPRMHAEQVHGDLTKPGLGLDGDTYHMLVKRVDTVIHCAAITAFAADESATVDLNIHGTENILRFAADADTVLHYVSSAFVARDAISPERIAKPRPIPLTTLPPSVPRSEWCAPPRESDDHSALGGDRRLPDRCGRQIPRPA